jgi:hypothetical protein
MSFSSIQSGEQDSNQQPITELTDQLVELIKS